MSEREHATAAQRGKSTDSPRRAPAPKPSEDDERLARNSAVRAIQLAHDVLAGEDGFEGELAHAPTPFVGALWTLYAALYDRHTDPESRLAKLDAAKAGLEPAFAIDPTPDWTTTYVRGPLAYERSVIQREIAEQSIGNSVLLGNGKAMVIPSDGEPHAQGAMLRPIIKQTVTDLKLIGERATKAGVPGSVKDVVFQLDTLDGLLALTDAELADKIAHDSGWAAVRDYMELVKAAVQVTKGGLVLATTLAARATIALGELEMGEKLLEGSRKFAESKTLGGIVAGIEIVHGVAEVFSGKTKFEQMDGAVDIATGALGGLDTLGVEAAGPAGAALTIGWIGFKLALGGIANTGAAITEGWMSHAVQRLASRGGGIADAGERLARITAALAVEKDPDQIKILTTLQTTAARSLGQQVDFVIDDFTGDLDIREIADPNNYRILREAFAPVMNERGHYGLGDAPRAAAAVLERIRFVVEHADALASAGAFGRDVSDVAAADQPDADD